MCSPLIVKVEHSKSPFLQFERTIETDSIDPEVVKICRVPNKKHSISDPMWMPALHWSIDANRLSFFVT